MAKPNEKKTLHILWERKKHELSPLTTARQQKRYLRAFLFNRDTQFELSRLTAYKK